LVLFSTKNSHTQTKVHALNKGGIVCCEHNSSRRFQPMRSDAFYKDIADKKSPNTRWRKCQK